MKRRILLIPLVLALAVSCAPTQRVTPADDPTLTPEPTRPAVAPVPTLTPMKPIATLALTPTPIKPSATSTPTTIPATADSLRFQAQSCDMQIGAAVAADPLRSDPLYAKTLAREFNLLTPENSMKFGPVHPDRDRYDFRDADAIVQFAEAHRMQVRGHTLVWHSQLPAWLTAGNWARDVLVEILRDHILTVVGRYRGRVVAWDVVNEAMGDSGSLRDTIWLRVIGPEYIDMAFHWAHEADPDALLFYNDYSAEGLGHKSDAIYALVQGLVQRGVPIHGVGLQMHTSLGACPRHEDVATNIDRLAALGLEVHITEMDVRIPEPVTEEELDAQARIYRDMLRVCISAENCTAFVLWGFADCHSWIPDFFPGYGAGLIFDENYDPKPACDALADVLTSP